MHFMTSYSSLLCTSSKSVNQPSSQRGLAVWPHDANSQCHPISLTPRTNHWLHARSMDAAPHAYAGSTVQRIPGCTYFHKRPSQDIAIRQSSARETGKAPVYSPCPSPQQTFLQLPLHSAYLHTLYIHGALRSDSTKPSDSSTT